MIDTREFVLARVEEVLQLIAPGVVFPLPGPPHREIMTDLHGRVFNRPRPDSKLDSSETPFVECITSSKRADTIEVCDDTFYTVTTPMEVWGYIKADDTGQEFNSPTRTALNALRADLIVAMESVPYWIGAAPNIVPSARQRAGLAVVLTGQETQLFVGSKTAWVVLDYDLRYRFNTHNP